MRGLGRGMDATDSICYYEELISCFATEQNMLSAFTSFTWECINRSIDHETLQLLFLVSVLPKSQNNHLTFPAAVGTSDFVTARAWGALMEPRLNHCVTAVSAAILKMNHRPRSLDLRNTSIIYWLKTRRRENLGLWIEMWGGRTDEVRGSHYDSPWRVVFLPKPSDFFSFSLSTYLTHTHSLSAGVRWSHEKQFHGRWPEPPQDLRL